MTIHPDDPKCTPEPPAAQPAAVLPPAPSDRVATGCEIYGESDFSFGFELRTVVTLGLDNEIFYEDESGDSYVDESGVEYLED